MAVNPSFSITEIVQNFGAKLKNFIRGKVSNNEDAEDILQDVWYQFSMLTNIGDIENISGWLFKVARNKVTDKYRKKTTDLLEDYSYENEDGTFDLKDILLMDTTDAPELADFKAYFWEVLMDALDELPEKQREVFLLNEIEDFTLKEIADQKGENLKTIISRKGYAVKHLRSRLQSLYNEFNL